MKSASSRNLESIIREGYTVKIGEYISRGWQTLQQNIGGFIGFFFLIFLINLGLGFIPFLGSIASFVIGAPLVAGFFLVSFKIFKNQATNFEDFFRGFNYFGPLFLASLMSGILIFLVSLPALIALIFFLAPVFQSAYDSSSGSSPSIGQPNLIFLIVAFLLYLPSIYLSVSYGFITPLVLDKKLGFWPAMETSRRLITKNWFSIFGFFIVLFLINLAGAIPLGLGLLITIPLSFCAVAAAYDDIVGVAIPSTADS